MPLKQPLDFLPLWGLFLATVGVVLISLEAGFRLGKLRRQRTEQEKEATVGTLVGATLGLLAFLLAFTFSLAAARFDARRQVLLDEANAIGTTYLRAGLLPEPHRTAVRKLLRSYVDIRLEGVHPDKVAAALAQCEDLHNQLWSHAEAVGKKEPNSIVVGLFIRSLNDVIDQHSKRVMISLRSRIPFIIWVALYLITILSMAGMGYQVGLSGTARSVVTPVLVLAFSGVMWLIADLDRPSEGLLQVSQEPMTDLRKSMEPPP